METLIIFLVTALVCGVAAFLISRGVIRNQQKHCDQMLADKENAQQQALEAKQKACEDALEAKEQACKQALDAKDLLQAQALEAKEQARQAEQKSFEETLKMREETHEKLMGQQKEKYEQMLKAKDEAHEKLMSELQEKVSLSMKQMSEQLKNETTEILKSRQEELQKSSSESLGHIVNPLKENLDNLKKILDESKVKNAENDVKMDLRIRSLLEQTESTRKSAEELANALKRDSKLQGNWGEMVLTELLNAQGLTEGRHFDIQPTIRDEHGNPIRSDDNRMLRPDVIVHLDEVREVIIDSKVSLTAYTDYVNASDEATKKAALEQHVRSIRAHIDDLAKKDYSNYIRAPKQSIGYVIMFVPIVSALWTALNEDDKLWRYAADKNVYMADEQSLYGALKIVNLTWTQIAQVQNQEKVYKLAEEMLKRVGAFLKFYNDMGKKLDEAKGVYDEGKKKLQDGGYSICTTAKQLVQLGVKSEHAEIKALPE